MISDPILLMGGTGAIGRLSARALRAIHPDVPLLIGGRDMAGSRRVAGEIGQAEGIAIDPGADDLGVGDRRISAVAVFHPSGAADLTALGVSMILERLVGLDGKTPTPPGLYFPFQVLDHATYLSRLQAEGGSIVPLDAE